MEQVSLALHPSTVPLSSLAAQCCLGFGPGLEPVGTSPRVNRVTGLGWLGWLDRIARSVRGDRLVSPRRAPLCGSSSGQGGPGMHASTGGDAKSCAHFGQVPRPAGVVCRLGRASRVCFILGKPGHRHGVFQPAIQDRRDKRGSRVTQSPYQSTAATFPLHTAHPLGLPYWGFDWRRGSRGQDSGTSFLTACKELPLGRVG